MSLKFKKVVKMKKILVFMISLFMFSTLVQAKQNTNFTLLIQTVMFFHVKGTNDVLVINELKNKIVFLEFFGHKCPPCLESISHYKNLQAKYKNQIAIISMEVPRNE